jgi:hypothetical protein
MELYVIKLINDWLKKRNNKKEWWLFLMIKLPISFILWYIVTAFFMMSNIWNVCLYDDLEWNSTLQLRRRKPLDKFLVK